MPGGRNSGAVYNMYKVKYKKNKKSPKQPNTAATVAAYNQYNMMKPRGMDLSMGVEKMETVPMYAMSSSGSSDQGTGEASSLSAPASPYHERPVQPAHGINILKAVLTGSPEVIFHIFLTYSI